MANQSFLNSMTFATGCSCDECGIPEEILEAVRKRQRLNEEESIKFLHANIQQKRELVARHGGYSIWRLVLPADGEGDPIVEMRNSWRVVFVEMLSDVSDVIHSSENYWLLLRLADIIDARCCF